MAFLTCTHNTVTAPAPPWLAVCLAIAVCPGLSRSRILGCCSRRRWAETCKTHGMNYQPACRRSLLGTGALPMSKHAHQTEGSKDVTGHPKSPGHPLAPWGCSSTHGSLCLCPTALWG